LDSFTPRAAARQRWLSTTGVLPSGHRARLQRDIVDNVIQFS
jgi:hypothetical protein